MEEVPKVVLTEKGGAEKDVVVESFGLGWHA